MSETVRIVLTEDDALLRESLESLLKLAGFAVTPALDGLSFYRALAEHRHFDVAIIDMGLPDAAGQTLIDFLRRNTNTAIIAITARDTIDRRVECYRAGADLFLGKPVDGRELIAAISSLATRSRAVAQSHPAKRVSWTLNPVSRRLTNPEGIGIELSLKACQLIQILFSSPGKTLSRHLLLETLYKRDTERTNRCLDQLVRRTRRAITEATGHPAPLLTEHGAGYAFVEPATVAKPDVSEYPVALQPVRACHNA